MHIGSEILSHKKWRSCKELGMIPQYYALFYLFTRIGQLQLNQQLLEGDAPKMQSISVCRILCSRRHIGIHEYQAIRKVERYGANAPKSILCTTAEDAKMAHGYFVSLLYFRSLSESKVVIKAQVLAGGRGQGTFSSGLKGGVKVSTKYQHRVFT